MQTIDAATTDPRAWGRIAQGQHMQDQRGRANALGGTMQPGEPPTISNLLDQVNNLLLNAQSNGNRFEMAADRLTGQRPAMPAGPSGGKQAGSPSSIEDRLRAIINQFQIHNEWMNDIATRFERAI